jgi:hypothetical protein
LAILPFLAFLDLDENLKLFVAKFGLFYFSGPGSPKRKEKEGEYTHTHLCVCGERRNGSGFPEISE